LPRRIREYRLAAGDSADPAIVGSIRQLIPRGPVARALLDPRFRHAAPACPAGELNTLVPLLRQGDYLVVEDTVVNGHPVRPDFGPGPLEAIESYLAANPRQLVADAARESKFGCTFAFRGYYKGPRKW